MGAAVSRSMNEEGSLAALLAPMSLATFRAEVYDKKPLLLRAADMSLPGAIRWADIENVIGDPAMLQGGQLSVSNVQGYHLDLLQLARKQGISPEQVAQRALDAGGMIYLRGFAQQHHRARALMHMLEHALGSFMHAENGLFVSFPGKSTGLHSDLAPTFVFMLQGRKRWRVYQEQSAPGVSGIPKEAVALGEPVIDAVLEPGDVLYFPARCYHHAEAVTSCALLSFAEWRATGRDLLTVISRYLRQKHPEFADRELHHKLPPDAFASEANALFDDLESLVLTEEFHRYFRDSIEAQRFAPPLHLPADLR
ncbi:MAG: JmjC domain-containing protein [Polyangiales bacterium]